MTVRIPVAKDITKRRAGKSALMVIDQHFFDERTQTHYGMADAARDLGVQCYWDPQIEIDKVMAEDQEP
jgi:hypothetical protein